MGWVTFYNFFKDSKIQISADFKYNSTCNNGDWDHLRGCLPVLCEPLQQDLGGSILNQVEGQENLLNTSVVVSCANSGDDFDFGLGIVHIQFTCGRRLVFSILISMHTTNNPEDGRCLILQLALTVLLNAKNL